MFDVLVFDERISSNRIVKDGLGKKAAKDLVKTLRNKGHKAQLVTSKVKEVEEILPGFVELPHDEYEDKVDYETEKILEQEKIRNFRKAADYHASFPLHAIPSQRA
jgi:hypothetical protein